MNRYLKCCGRLLGIKRRFFETRKHYRKRITDAIKKPSDYEKKFWSVAEEK